VRRRDDDEPGDGSGLHRREPGGCAVPGSRDRRRDADAHELLFDDVATNEIYATSGSSLLEFDEPVAVPVPITTEIEIESQSGVGAELSFEATTGFAPFALPIRQIYYQVDGTDGEWTPADAPGASAGADLVLGMGPHTVYAFATDGQEATLSAAHGRTPVVGQIASIEVVITRQCSNGIDDDGDTFVDFPADPQCRSASDNDELTNPSCGLGAELALAMAALARIRSRSATKRLK
jgi:hypothetical protein